MWWREKASKFRNLRNAAWVILAGALCAGCFQPLYADRTSIGSPGVKDALANVAVLPIEAGNGTPAARLGIEVRNALLFDLYGGAAVPISPAYELKINLVPLRRQIIVDITTARPDVENYGIDATYSLTDVATKKIVVTGRTFSRVSYDIPGQQQRFARARGMRDSENRAAQVLAEQIKMRLASYFLAGT